VTSERRGDELVGSVADPPPDELVVLVLRTAKALVERMRAGHNHEAHAASSSMTAMHGLAARYLLDREDVTAAELARHLRITKQSASEVVGHLEQAGFVRRAPHPADGRARVLLLTDVGRAKLADGQRRWEAVEAEWAQLVGRDELDAVRHALEAYLAVDATRDVDDYQESQCTTSVNERRSGFSTGRNGRSAG
jgi:DNA-binding MarR family transcriptional regulator